jgi:hypothetical protein
MFLEYIKLLSIGAQPEFSYEYIFPIALILLSVIAIVFIGYKLKEELGAIIAILICGLFFLYMNDLIRILDAYTLSSLSKKPEIKEVEKTKLNPVQDRISPSKYTVYLHYSNEKNKKQVEELATFLKNQGFKVERIERINYKNIDVRYFHGEDKSAALLLKKNLTQFINLYTNLKITSIKTFNLGHKYPTAKKGALELWVSF